MFRYELEAASTCFFNKYLYKIEIDVVNDLDQFYRSICDLSKFRSLKPKHTLKIAQTECKQNAWVVCENRQNSLSYFPEIHMSDVCTYKLKFYK